MTMTLFRREAISYHRDRLWGEVVLTQPISFAVFSMAIGLALAFLIIYLVVGTYTRKETVKGYLVPTEGLVQIYAPWPGTVSELVPRQGDYVSRGDVLVRVRTDRALTDGLTMNALLIDLLDQQKNKVQNRIARHVKRKAVRHQYLEEKTQGIERQIEQLERQITLQEKRLALVNARYHSLEGLRKDELISEEEYEARFHAILEERQHMERLAQSLIAETARLNEARFEADSLESDTQEILDQLTTEIARIDQQRLQHQGEHAFSIKAPIDGYITSLQAVVGQMVQPQRPLMAILPENNHLRAELFVPTRAIGFIESQLPVRIRYDAFPYERFGIHESRIEQVSKTILAPDEVASPIRPNMPVYRVTANLAGQTLDAYGRQMPLQAGMTIEADILLDERPLYQWILRPLYSLARGR